MATISQKIHNYNYAPGIATYGMTGQTGDAGENGSTIFFTNLSFSKDSEFKLLVNQIINNYLPIRNSVLVLTRKYLNDDIFFTLDGLIYQLVDIDSLLTDLNIGKYNKYFQIKGRVSVDTTNYLNYLSNSQRLELNTNYKGFDLVTTSSDASNYINNEAVMNIISDNLDDYNNINLLQFTAVNSYNNINNQFLIYFDTNDNSYHVALNNDGNLIINSDVKINQTFVEKELDNYSSVLTSSDPIVVFKTICSNISYNVTKKSDDNNIILLSIYIKSDADYYNLMQTKFNDIKDNIFVKVYTSNNTLLYRLKDVSSDDIRTIDDQTIYTIELNDYITSTDQIMIVSLLYNTEIILNKYGTTSK